MDPETSFLIIGGSGTFDLSTAWHLARKGYSNVQCVDRWPAPSPSSAGFDRNKIIRTEYSSPMHTVLAHQALELWKDDLFKDVFHHTGWLFGTDGAMELGKNENFYKSVENTQDFGDDSEMTLLNGWHAAVDKLPVLGSDPNHTCGKENFKGIFNANAGWVESAKAILLIKGECDRLGVKFSTGLRETVTALLRNATDKVIGARSEDGTEWLADKIILSAGAYCSTLLDFQDQVQACAYVISHFRMNEDQYQRYKNMPVLNISRLGYCFPPNEDRIFKICSTDTNYINTENLEGIGPVSVPRDQAYHPNDTQPSQGESLTRSFMQWLLPELVGSEIVSSRMCWDLECFDYSWLIGPHPQSPDSLFLATGGSGHSFKNFPHLGQFVV